MSYLTHRVDGELGRWTLVEWRPPHLRDTVERFWHFTGRTALPRERVLPSGLLQLVVHLDARYGIVRDSGVERYPALVMSGQRTQPFVIEAPKGASTLFSIEFTPAGMAAGSNVASRPETANRSTPGTIVTSPVHRRASSR